MRRAQHHAGILRRYRWRHRRLDLRVRQHQDERLPSLPPRQLRYGRQHYDPRHCAGPDRRGAQRSL
nr:MAG TPA: hypothetical protein [Caudoviricetes sp.]